MINKPSFIPPHIGPICQISNSTLIRKCYSRLFCSFKFYHDPTKDDWSSVEWAARKNRVLVEYFIRKWRTRKKVRKTMLFPIVITCVYFYFFVLAIEYSRDWFLLSLLNSLHKYIHSFPRFNHYVLNYNTVLKLWKLTSTVTNTLLPFVSSRVIRIAIRTWIPGVSSNIFVTHGNYFVRGMKLSKINLNEKSHCSMQIIKLI